MATATKDTITKTVTSEVKEDVIVLTLSSEEAAVLLAVTGKLSGSFDGPRKVTDSIYNTLTSADVRAAWVEMTPSGYGARIEKATTRPFVSSSPV